MFNNLETIFERFVEVQSQLNPDKKDIAKYGEVYTPDYLVDNMVLKASDGLLKAQTTLDLCCGIGQFTIGMLIFLAVNKTDFNLDTFLSNHTFVEIQEKSIERLRYIFGPAAKICSIEEILFKNFDICFSNPPYKGVTHLKIITQVYNTSKEFIIVHPATWLIDLKNKYKPYLKFKALVEKDSVSYKLFNGNPVFGIGLFAPCVVTHLRKDNDNKTIDVNYFGDKFKVSSLEDITVFGSNWESLVKPFFNKMKKFCEENGSVWDRRISELPEDYNNE